MRASVCSSDGRPYMPEPAPGRALLPALGVMQNISAEGMTGSGMCATYDLAVLEE
jgi:hypothetical protein